MIRPIQNLSIAFACLLLCAKLIVFGQVENQSGIEVEKLWFQSTGADGFNRLSPKQTGVTFKNLLDDERSIRNRNLLSGSGVAAGDVNNDGLSDLYFCGLDNGNKLYQNMGGWKFVDITKKAGVDCDGQDSTAAAFADIDNDGDLDLLVNALGGGTRLFENHGSFDFIEITDFAGLRSNAGSMSMTLADIENDGDLDLYVANFHPVTIKDNPNTRIRVKLVDGKPVVSSVNGVSANNPKLKGRFEVSGNRNVLEYGEPDFLFINNGNKKFTKVEYLDYFFDETGRRLKIIPMDWGLAARFADVNMDGYPDLYVCNDLFTPDRFWINDKTGKFREIKKLALRNTSTFSMGVDFSDIDRDGDFDFFVVDMLSRSHEMKHVQVSELISNNEPKHSIYSRPQFSRNTLQVNRGDGTYAELAQFANVQASEWSWGPIFLDVDLDGYEDILVTNGQLRDFQNADMTAHIEEEKSKRNLTQSKIFQLMAKFPDLRTPNVAFKNNKDGTFTDFSTTWRFNHTGISQGMALADLDNDGDLDVVMNNLVEFAGIYENEASGPRTVIRLKGKSNTHGVGARITIEQEGLIQHQELISGGRYLSSDEPVRSFGVKDKPFKITISWPNGTRQEISNAKPNYAYTFHESAKQNLHIIEQAEAHLPLFVDVTSTLDHKHHERPFQDFRRQLLMPIKYSQSGPGVSWIDVNQDDWDDLVITNGAGGKLSVFKNGKNGDFELLESKILLRTNWDQTMSLPIDSDDSHRSLIVGISNYESAYSNLPSGAVYNFDENRTYAIRTGLKGSTGPMCQADIDGDGGLEVFIGGQSIPGQYPVSADSALVKHTNSGFKILHNWDSLGLIQSAVFSDIYGDHRPELILTQHWGTLRVFTWESQKSYKPTEITRFLGLENYSGWWNGVATGDFNKDGLIDIVATNWGLNWRKKPTRRSPKRIYYGDIYEDGRAVALEASRVSGEWRLDRRLGVLRAAIPILGEQMESFEALGKSTVAQAIGNPLQKAAVKNVNEFRSGVFLNSKDGQMTFNPLPLETQWSPGFGVVVEDFNLDGHLDLFVAQNFFATNPEYSRCDAGRGALLLGDGKSNFFHMKSEESGIEIYGEQRSCAVSDFDQDGRPDLVVSQNSGSTKIYKNNLMEAGILVGLNGGNRNRDGFGAKIRSTTLNWVKEIQSGSGFWGHNSSEVIVPRHIANEAIAVTWPSGKRNVYKIPKDIKFAKIDVDGKILIVR